MTCNFNCETSRKGIFIMRYNTVIFDLDGTLLNTLDDLSDSLNDILSEFGYATVSVEDVRHFVGNGARNLIRLALPDNCSEDVVTQVFEKFKIHYNNNMQKKTRPYNGIMELLLDLQRYNYKIAIVSNKFDSAVKSLVQIYFGNLITVAIGETNEIKRKPAPDSIFTAVKELGADINRTILVGDSETDVRTAKNAGIPCIGVTWGFRNREVLRSEGADYLIDTPREILTII